MLVEVYQYFEYSVVSKLFSAAILSGRLSAGAAEEKLARPRYWCGGVLVAADRHVKAVTSAQKMGDVAVLLAEAMPVGADATVVDIAADRAARTGQADCYSV